MEFKENWVFLKPNKTRLQKNEQICQPWFITRFKVIRSYLPLMPMPMNDALTDDQLCALVERAVPRHWYWQFQLQQTLGTGDEMTLSTMIQYFKVC